MRCFFVGGELINLSISKPVYLGLVMHSITAKRNIWSVDDITILIGVTFKRLTSITCPTCSIPLAKWISISSGKHRCFYIGGNNRPQYILHDWGLIQGFWRCENFQQPHWCPIFPPRNNSGVTTTPGNSKKHWKQNKITLAAISRLQNQRHDLSSG